MSQALALEIAANLFNAASIWLAGRNSIHTFWTGICGCALFGVVFWTSKLYADVTLQLFFIGSSVLGHWRWRARRAEAPLPVQYTPAGQLAGMLALALALSAGYAALLARFTDAAAPLVDSLVLFLSVLGQLLLVARRVESWWCWIAVNTLSVPLYASRGLILTAVLYFGFWINACVALVHWRRLARAAELA